MLRRRRHSPYKRWQSPSPKQSPIKDNPLRNPGQSLDEAIHTLADEEAAPWIMAMVFIIVMTGYEWWRWYAKLPYIPRLMTLMCVGVTAYCLFRLHTFNQKIKTLKMARDGEKAVGQYLERLREQGYSVFHDVVSKNFNLDHVIIGPQGIFTIETKTFRKPVSGNATIHFDGSTIRINGHECLSDPVTQAIAQANWFSEFIKESTGRTYSVKPVVVFPGWFVQSGSEVTSGHVWVINPKGLPKFLDKSPRKLSLEETKLIAYHLSRYIRTQPSFST